MGAFRIRMCLCLAEGPVCAFDSASKISVPCSSGDRFGDWVVSASPPSGDFGPQSLRLKIALPAAGLVRSLIGGGWSLIMLNERENILSALREKPLKVHEIMKRVKYLERGGVPVPFTENERRWFVKVRYSQRTMAHRMNPQP